ncbi:MAG TPA: electron transfer flavoprotein subunit beta/FixA family protein [Saprospiraceae bacterium]|nr:electron transfer flavoprotein subunit beta/FixA family protein [Saprospiraceae bacterium]
MKLLVCISKTPETTAKVAFKDNGTMYDTAGVTFMLNPYDEWYALVRALELKEKSGGTVTVINVGTTEDDVMIRKALAIGADDAVRVDAAPRDAYFTASQIAAFARDKNFDLIFTGKETIDYNGSMVGGMIAEMLDLPFISYVSHLEMENGITVVTRDIEGGVEISEVNLPMVCSAAKGLAEQRIPNMRGIMTSKTKPLSIIKRVEVSPMIQDVRYTLPPQKSAVHMLQPDQMDELVRLLREEAKVI